MNIHTPRYEHPVKVPKIMGSDTELGNVDRSRNDRGRTASRAVVRKVDGVPAGYRKNWAQDAERRFLSSAESGNAGSIYVDMNHCELASPEVASAFELVPVTHGMFKVAREAVVKANAERGEDENISLLVNNSDGFSNSYGSHLSVLMSRTAYDRLLGLGDGSWRPHLVSWLASTQASAILCTGQGKVGSENRMPQVPFQISKRADFFECMVDEETTRNRPLVNARDEAEADEYRFARLHSIFFDATLCHTTIALRGGIMQLLLAMIEAEVTAPSLIFEDPLRAVHVYSHDPSLQTKVGTVCGQSLTVLEHQLLLHEEASRFVEGGHAEGYIAEAPRILELWGRMLEAFRTEDVDLLARNIDWVAKKQIISRAMETRGLQWGAPDLMVLDHRWGDLDPEVGLYLRLEAAGKVDRLVSEDAIVRSQAEPPVNTRAYSRSHLLRAILREGGREKGAVKIKLVDWPWVLFSWKGAGYEVCLPDPAAGRQVTGNLEGLDLGAVVEALGGRKISSISGAINNSSRARRTNGGSGEDNPDGEKPREKIFQFSNLKKKKGNQQ